MTNNAAGSTRDPFYFARQQLEARKANGYEKDGLLKRLSDDWLSKNEYPIPHEVADALFEVADQTVQVEATDAEYDGWQGNISATTEDVRNYQEKLSERGEVELPRYHELANSFTFQIDIPVYRANMEHPNERYRVFAHWHRNSVDGLTPVEYVEQEFEDTEVTSEGFELAKEATNA